MSFNFNLIAPSLVVFIALPSTQIHRLEAGEGHGDQRQVSQLEQHLTIAIFASSGFILPAVLGLFRCTSAVFEGVNVPAQIRAHRWRVDQ
jgi:hypothetical protein